MPEWRNYRFYRGNRIYGNGRGKSFPSEYTWVQSNDFSIPCSIMAAVARIPFAGGCFRGCISVIWYKGKEYRLATYLGAKVRFCGEKGMILEQGRYRLEIRINTEKGFGHCLSAPKHGEMSRIIIEDISVPAEFSFYIKGTKVFHLYSENASYEYER